MIGVQVVLALCAGLYAVLVWAERRVLLASVLTLVSDANLELLADPDPDSWSWTTPESTEAFARGWFYRVGGGSRNWVRGVVV